MAIGDPYYDDLVEAAAGAGGSPAAGGMLSKGGKLLKTAGPGLLTWLLLQKGVDLAASKQNIDFAKEVARAQGEAVTPESIYQEAALPGATARANQARQALLTQLSGGIIGPSLAPGERMIGG